MGKISRLVWIFTLYNQRLIEQLGSDLIHSVFGQRFSHVTKRLFPAGVSFRPCLGGLHDCIERLSIWVELLVQFSRTFRFFAAVKWNEFPFAKCSDELTRAAHPFRGGEDVVTSVKYGFPLVR